MSSVAQTTEDHLWTKITALEESVIDYGMEGDLESAANYLHSLHVELCEHEGDDVPHSVEYDANIDEHTLRRVLDWATDEGHPACVWYPDNPCGREPVPAEDRVFTDGSGGDDA